MKSNFGNVFAALRFTALLSSVCLGATLFGCNHASQPGANAGNAGAKAGKAAAGDGALEAAVFTKSLQTKEACTSFDPSETIYLSLKFGGRPATGITTAKFYYDNEFITEGKVDFADVNKGVLFSAGECTYANFTLSHAKPFPAGDKYRAEVFLNGKPLGTYKFAVGGPEKAANAEKPAGGEKAANAEKPADGEKASNAEKPADGENAGDAAKESDS